MANPKTVFRRASRTVFFPSSWIYTARVRHWMTGTGKQEPLCASLYLYQLRPCFPPRFTCGSDCICYLGLHPRVKSESNHSWISCHTTPSCSPWDPSRLVLPPLPRHVYKNLCSLRASLSDPPMSQTHTQTFDRQCSQSPFAIANVQERYRRKQHRQMGTLHPPHTQADA